MRHAEQNHRADNAKDDGHHPNVAGQPSAEEQADLKSKQAVKKRQPRVQQEHAKANDGGASQ